MEQVRQPAIAIAPPQIGPELGSGVISLMPGVSLTSLLSGVALGPTIPF